MPLPRKVPAKLTTSNTALAGRISSALFHNRDDLQCHTNRLLYEDLGLDADDELRLDPHDWQARTFDHMTVFYSQWYSADEIEEYWMTRCQVLEGEVLATWNRQAGHPLGNKSPVSQDPCISVRRWAVERSACPVSAVQRAQALKNVSPWRRMRTHNTKTTNQSLAPPVGVALARIDGRERAKENDQYHQCIVKAKVGNDIRRLQVQWPTDSGPREALAAVKLAVGTGFADLPVPNEIVLHYTCPDGDMHCLDEAILGEVLKKVVASASASASYVLPVVVARGTPDLGRAAQSFSIATPPATPRTAIDQEHDDEDARSAWSLA